MAVIEFPEKLANTAVQWRILGSTRKFSILITLAFGLMLVICRVDKSAITTFLQASNTVLPEIAISPREFRWVSVELESNYTTKLYSHWTEPVDSICKESKTHEIRVPRFDQASGSVSFVTGKPHEIFFQAVDENGTSRCLGGDFFEIDLSGEKWKSRPPMKDYGNGSYSFVLQVHPEFSGEYNLTIILLFRHYQGLKFSPTRFVIDKQLVKKSIFFTGSSSVPGLPPLPACKRSDFNRTLWAGRWTRHGRNDDCEISDDGRYRCLPADYPCSEPWCSGQLGLLESNGWVYSAHCGFELFSTKSAWKCLNNKWLFWWGDSNHVDSIRNLVFFVLGIHDVESVGRRFDKTFTNPQNGSEKIRITNIFNGHWDDKSNYEGLNSLSNETYRDLLKSYFNNNSSPAIPDVVIFNSGLHDGVKWKNLRRFVASADYAAEFWSELMKQTQQHRKPRFVFRSTITTAGYARSLAFNPSKMDAFNGVLLDKLMKKGVVDAVVDDFDMTWAWHFDNRCNDGVHYGRFPAKLKWRDGGIGHQYFVDLMLGHVLLNAICAV